MVQELAKARRPEAVVGGGAQNGEVVLNRLHERPLVAYIQRVHERAVRLDLPELGVGRRTDGAEQDDLGHRLEHQLERGQVYRRYVAEMKLEVGFLGDRG